MYRFCESSTSRWYSVFVEGFVVNARIVSHTVHERLVIYISFRTYTLELTTNCHVLNDFGSKRSPSIYLKCGRTTNDK